MIAIWTHQTLNICAFSQQNWILSTLHHSTHITYFSLSRIVVVAACIGWTLVVSQMRIWYLLNKKMDQFRMFGAFGIPLQHIRTVRHSDACCSSWKSCNDECRVVCVCLCRTKRSIELHTHSAKPYLIIWVDLSQHSALCPVNGNKLRSISELSVCFVEYKLCVLCVFGFCCRRPMSRRCVLVAHGGGVGMVANLPLVQIGFRLFYYLLINLAVANARMRCRRRNAKAKEKKTFVCIHLTCPSRQSVYTLINLIKWSESRWQTNIRTKFTIEYFFSLSLALAHWISDSVCHEKLTAKHIYDFIRWKRLVMRWFDWRK